MHLSIIALRAGWCSGFVAGSANRVSFEALLADPLESPLLLVL